MQQLFFTQPAKSVLHCAKWGGTGANKVLGGAIDSWETFTPFLSSYSPQTMMMHKTKLQNWRRSRLALIQACGSHHWAGNLLCTVVCLHSVQHIHARNSVASSPSLGILSATNKHSERGGGRCQRRGCVSTDFLATTR